MSVNFHHFSWLTRRWSCSPLNLFLFLLILASIHPFPADEHDRHDGIHSIPFWPSNRFCSLLLELKQLFLPYSLSTRLASSLLLLVLSTSLLLIWILFPFIKQRSKANNGSHDGHDECSQDVPQENASHRSLSSCHVDYDWKKILQHVLPSYFLACFPFIRELSSSFSWLSAAESEIKSSYEPPAWTSPLWCKARCGVDPLIAFFALPKSSAELWSEEMNSSPTVLSCHRDNKSSNLHWLSFGFSSCLLPTRDTEGKAWWHDLQFCKMLPVRDVTLISLAPSYIMVVMQLL